MSFSDLELLYLFSLIRDDLQRLEKRYKRLEFMYDRTDNKEKRREYQLKLALVISEYRTLDPLLKRFADEIALRELGKK